MQAFTPTTSLLKSVNYYKPLPLRLLHLPTILSVSFEVIAGVSPNGKVSICAVELSVIDVAEGNSSDESSAHQSSMKLACSRHRHISRKSSQFSANVSVISVRACHWCI